MKDPFHRSWPFVSAAQDAWVIARGRISGDMREFVPRAIEAVHRALALRAGHPTAFRAELEFCEFRLEADRVDGGEKQRRVDPIDRNGERFPFVEAVMVADIFSSLVR